MEAFFERTSDDRFAPTEHTRGPWNPNSQHAGPPAALLGRAVQLRPGAREDMRLARITFEIMRPVPIAPLTVAVHVVREGRSVELVEASLTPDEGEEVMRARALRIRTEPGVAPRVAADPPTPDFTTAQDDGSFRFPWDVGYHTAMEYRFSSGTFLERGPAACWLRMKVALVAGEKIAPLDRVLVAADSGNGVSNALDMAAHVFINPDLTVHLHRHPTGEWVCIDSATTVEADGIGLADTVLHDQDGPIGRSAQSLFIAGRD